MKNEKATVTIVNEDGSKKAVIKCEHNQQNETITMHLEFVPEVDTTESTFYADLALRFVNSFQVIEKKYLDKETVEAETEVENDNVRLL